MLMQSLFRLLPLGCALIVMASTAALADKRPQEVARGAYPDLTVDPEGRLHLVYVRDGQLFYRRGEQDAQTWSPEQNTGLPQGMVERSDPEVVTDSQHRPHVLVGSSYGWFDGTRWESMKLDAVRDTALAIDSQDNIYVVRRGGPQGGFLGLLVRRAGASHFEPMSDPDVASGLPLGRNDHVYGHIAVDPSDDSLHVVYRHGKPRNCAYRVSTDGGRTWQAGGISDDDREAPSLAIVPGKRVYAVTGTGEVFSRGDRHDEWQSLGRALRCEGRDLPVLAAGGEQSLYAGSFGGRINCYAGGKWLAETTLPRLADQPLGFVDLAAAPNGRVYAVWEQGDGVHNDQRAGESAILFAQLEAATVKQRQGKTPPAENRQPPVAPKTVGRWDRFEAGVVNGKDYGDPYRDVTLEVDYTRPDGSTQKFWGFYAGGRLWKFRFMPDQVGPWKYTARFSDGSTGTSGAFECTTSDLLGMISRDETNPMWFGYRGGKHTLVRGLHVGDRFFAANWPDAERRRFLDWVGKQGYNTLSIASHFLKREARDRGGDWQIPKLWPLDAAEYDRLESTMDELARRRIMIFPFAGFFGQKSNYPTDPDQQEQYIRYTLARLGPYWNLMLSVAGPEPNIGKRWMEDADVQRLGRLVARLDPFEHLISVHNRTGDDPYRDADWTTYGVLQGPKTNDLARLSRGLLESHHPNKPLLAQETLWSGNVNHIRALKGRDYTDQELRNNAWVIHMSAAALVFADNGGGNSSAGFSGTLDPAQAAQQRHDIIKQVWDLAEQFPFYQLKPRQDLVTAGYCLAQPGHRYLVYLPAADNVKLQLDAARYSVEWIDPQEARRRPGGHATGVATLTPPAAERPWLLWLQRTE